MIACLFLNQSQTPSFVERQLSLEKRAVASAKRMLAFDLDAKLPRLSFADWFGQVVGPGAGVIWQLSECGERSEVSLNATGDIRACVEANAMLADGRRVILMLAVGTFKRGMTGVPAFQFGVIEQEGQLYAVRRLRDLQKLLSAPRNLANRLAVKLPEANMPEVRLAVDNTYMVVALAWGGEEFDRDTTIEEPPPQAPRASSNATSIAEAQDTSEDSGRSAASGEVKLLGSVSWGDVIKKTQPRYPAQAKRVKASGLVNVQITISEAGRVIEAKAISGHPLLREAAVEAARQWVFKPAMLNGALVETQRVLTFVFTVLQ